VKASTARSKAAVRFCFLHKSCQQLRTRNRPRSCSQFQPPALRAFLLEKNQCLKDGKYSEEETLCEL
jgi:hypothetical protein